MTTTMPNTMSETMPETMPNTMPGVARITKILCLLCVAFCLFVPDPAKASTSDKSPKFASSKGSSVNGTTGKKTETASVFLGVARKETEMVITRLSDSRQVRQPIDDDGFYSMPGEVGVDYVHVSARAVLGDLSSGRETQALVLLSAVDRVEGDEIVPQVNVLSHLVAVRANALAGPSSRGPYSRIVMPHAIEQAERQLQDALSAAMREMRRDDSTLSTEKDPRAEGSAGQAQLVHVSMVLSEAAARRSTHAGADPGIALAGLLGDLAQEFTTLGRFTSATVQELQEAEAQMDAVPMLRRLMETDGIGESLLVHYL